MNIKLVLALTALVLLQYSSGNPTTSEDTSKKLQSTASDKKALDSRENEIVTNLQNELNELSEISVKATKQLIKDVLDDLNAIEDKSDAIKAKIVKLSEADSEVDKINSQEQNKPFSEKFYLLVRITNLMGVDTISGEKSDEDLFIETSLRNHGRLIMQKEFEEKFIGACKMFYESVNEYWNSLSAKEQQEKEILGNWLEGFKEATSDINKMTEFLALVIDFKN